MPARLTCAVYCCGSTSTTSMRPPTSTAPSASTADAARSVSPPGPGRLHDRRRRLAAASGRPCLRRRSRSCRPRCRDQARPAVTGRVARPSALRGRATSGRCGVGSPAFRLSQHHHQQVAHRDAGHDLAARREPRRQRSIPRQPRHVWRTGGRIGAYSATESDRPAGMAGDVRRQVSDRCEVRGYRKLGHCLGLLPGHLRCHGTARRAAAAGCQGVACRRWPCLPR